MNRQRGFTLIELIITVTIAAIVLAIGVPSFQGMMRNNRAAAYTNEFMSALGFARSEAVKRGQRVVLCPSNDAATCTGSNWESGWIIFVDVANDAPNAAGDVVLRIHEALGGNTTLRGNANVSTYISFSFDGSTRLSGGNAFQAGTLTFSLCDTSNQQNNIIINAAGRARVSKAAPTTTSCTY